MISTLFYLFVFMIVLTLFYFSEHAKAKQRKVCACLAILILCFVAGLRDETVGVDVKVYITRVLPIVHDIPSLTVLFSKSSFNSALNIGGEYIYAILLFVCSRFENGQFAILFSLQFLTIVPIYLAAKKIKKKYRRFDLTLSMAVYLFLYFNNSLNLMRQSVCCAFVILGITILRTREERRVIDYIPFFIALFFHKSCLIGIILFVLIAWIVKNRRSISRMRMFAFSALIVSLPLVIEKSFEIFRMLGLSNASFDYYADIFIYRTVDKDYFVNPLSLYSLSFQLFIIIFSVFMTYYSSRNRDYIEKEEFEDVSFFKTCILYGYMIYMIILYSMNTMYGMRVTLFLDMVTVLAFPLVCKTKKQKVICFALIITCWLLLVVKMGWSASNNYTFA